MDMKSQIDRWMLWFAFRYALGHMSTAPLVVVDQLEKYWPDLPQHDKQLFQREVAEAIQGGRAGMAMDVACWQRVLEWATE